MSKLRRFARTDRRCQALEAIFGVGPILADHLLTEIGGAHRFDPSRQLVGASGLDPTVLAQALALIANIIRTIATHTPSIMKWSC